jgi:FkbM family methyltransferase
MSTFRKRLSVVPGVRPIALRLLRAVGGRDLTLRHPVTRDALFLNLFLHRGYWFHRETREASETAVVAAVVGGAQGTIVDVGANIGFLSLIYRGIAPDSDVVAVEPSPKNLRYLRANVESAGIRVVPVAVGASQGVAVLFEDSLTGQNSSLVEGFKVLAANASLARQGEKSAEVQVEVTTLDRLLESARRPVTFIKIDVEGFELEALRGAQNLMVAERPIIQVEVQRQVAATLELLSDVGYRLFASEQHSQLVREESPSVVFAVHAASSELARFMSAAEQNGYREIS